MPLRRARVWSALSVTLLVGVVGACPPSAPPPPITDLVVTFDGAPAAPVLLLFSGMRAGECQRFEPFVGTGAVTLVDVSYAATCPVEIDVFAAERSAVAMSGGTGAPDWFTEALAAGTLTIPLGPSTKLPITFWLVAGGADLERAESLRDRIVTKALPVLDAVGTGLTLDTTSIATAPGSIIARCEESDAISSAPSTYDGGRINVYLVETFGNTTVNKAETCYRDEHREIVFIAWGNEDVGLPVLAHELGHVLGLIRPAPGGHTYLVPGFSAANYMAQNADILDASVGQIYTMNFSSDSWLNQPGNPLARPVVRTCQDSWSGPGACPPLTLHATGWP